MGDENSVEKVVGAETEIEDDQEDGATEVEEEADEDKV